MKHSEERPLDILHELEYAPPRPERMQAMREVLAALPPPPATALGDRSQRMWIAGGAGALVAAAAAAVFAIISAGSTPEVNETPSAIERATVHPAQGARFLHTPGEAGAAEIIRLSEGTVHIEVAPLARGERMLLRTMDAELEVHGTVFDVSARGESLTGVAVIEGVVELRLDGTAAPVMLRAGMAWRPPATLREAEPTPPLEQPAEPAKAAPAKRRAKMPSTENVPPHERAFRDAWAAFARGDMEQAAELFADAEVAAPESSLAEDAAYGRALALERAGRRREAIVEMDRFLGLHPTSIRAEEVSVSLGWLLLDAGKFDEAKQRFEHALQSPVPRIRRSAERGAEEAAARVRR